MTRRAAVLQKIVHVLTALTLLLKGVAKLEHPEGYWPVILFFFASAAYIAAIAVLHDRLHHHVRRITASVYALESLATAAMACVYAHEGKKGLPWAAGAASAMFLVALVVHLVKTGGNGPHPDRVKGA
ncbi:MAG TPA: hypothetical protein VGF28_12485 [Thermoanaerobaculia bacterium]